MPGRVLVVEDRDSLRKLVVRALEEEGFDVDSAADGEEAREFLYVEHLVRRKVLASKRFQEIPRFVELSPERRIREDPLGVEGVDVGDGIHHRSIIHDIAQNGLVEVPILVEA